MAIQPRLLPIVICAASALLVLKLVDLGAALAQTSGGTPPAATPSPASPPPPTPPQAAPSSQPASSQSAPSQLAAAAPAAAPQTASDASSSATVDDPEAKRDPLQMSPEEVTELQQLAARRLELDKRDADLSEREVLMAAAEKRVDEKIAKLEALQKSIDAVAKQKDDENEARITSLGHMYEQMKPAEAARILEQLDVPVLIEMLSHIREMKAAPILAAMDPEKAKAVTLALAEQKSSDAAPPATAAPAQQP